MPVSRVPCTISRHPVRRAVSESNALFECNQFDFIVEFSISALINPDLSNPVSHMGEGPFFGNYKVLVPVCLSLIAIGSFIGIVILIRKRKLTNQNRLPSASISESPSTANLQNKQNRDQQYQVVRCQSNRNSNSNDSGSFKAEGNGEYTESFTTQAQAFSTLTDVTKMLNFSSNIEYIEDICPYATFQLNKQTYSESSYSGNIYSGPYHSVRGSFVYHDSKPDGYHVN